MSESSPKTPERLDDLCEIAHMLSNPHRLRILQALLKKPLDVKSIVQAGAIPQANTSHHLMRLLRTGMVVSTRDGNRNIYSLSGKGIDFQANGYRVVLTKGR